MCWRNEDANEILLDEKATPLNHFMFGYVCIPLKSALSDDF